MSAAIAVLPSARRRRREDEGALDRGTRLAVRALEVDLVGASQAVLIDIVLTHSDRAIRDAAETELMRPR